MEPHSRSFHATTESLQGHLPYSLLSHITSQEDLLKGKLISSAPRIPLLFIDISGFTKLSTTLSVNDLSICINEYFTELILCVQEWGGDVLKFAGDALFVTFPPTQDTLDPTLRLIQAARCAHAVVTTLSDYKPSLSPSTLNVHCGIAFDSGKFFVVGAATIPRAEILLFGPVIEAVAAAEVQAGLGEVFCCPSAQQTLNLKSPFLCSNIKQLDLPLPSPLRSSPPPDSSNPTMQPSLDYETLKPFAHETVTATLADGGQLQPELRPVYTIFLKSIPNPKIEVTLDLLQRIMEVSGEEVSNAGGNLRQFIVDDKGIVLIFNFGLFHAVFKNMASAAVTFANKLSGRLARTLLVCVRVGISFGRGYCGVVGSPRRHEFSIMGSSVNLAARLMCSPCPAEKPTHVIIDEATVLQSQSDQSSSGESFAFVPLEAIKAKGFTEPVKIFTTIEKRRELLRKSSSSAFSTSSFQSVTSNAVKNFVGRSTEMTTILGALGDWTEPAFVTLVGEGGIGKTTLALKVAEELKERANMDVIVLQGQCGGITNKNAILPFSSTKRIFASLLSALNADSVNGVKRLAEICGFDEGIVLPTLHLYGLTSEGGEGKVKLQEVTKFVAKLFTLQRGHSKVLILLDDAHAIDKESLGLLRNLIETPNVPLLTILTSRPHNSPHLGTSFEISPFEKGEVTQMLITELLRNGGGISKASPKRTTRKKSDKKDDKKPQSLSSSKSSSIGNMSLKPASLSPTKRPSKAFAGDSVSDDLLAITGGNPLFLHEIIKLILGEGLLQSTGKAVVWREDKREEREAVLDKVCGYNNVSELVLSKLDDLSGVTRFFVEECAVIGREFSTADLELLGWRDNDIEDCIVELEDCGIVEVDDASNADEGMMGESDLVELLDLGFYRFTHQVFCTSIYNKQLSNVVEKVHLRYAIQLAEHREPTNSSLTTQLQHLSVTNHFTKGYAIATVLSERYTKQAMYEFAIDCCSLTLLMKDNVGEDKKEVCVGRINLTVQQAKCHFSKAEKKRGTELYEKAKTLFEKGFKEGNVTDASIVFPIISGLSLALKWGTLEDDENATYEKALVNTFIESARAYGDMAHVSRALALKGVMYQRLGLWEKALEAQVELEKCYEVGLSARICEAYGSDRAAQSITLAPQWEWIVAGETMTKGVQGAIEKGVNLLESPEMERRNVHNKVMMLYPLLTIWFVGCDDKIDVIVRGRDLWQRHVIDAFNELYDTDSKIFFKDLFKPVFWFLTLALGEAVEENQVKERREYLVEVMEAGSLDNGRFATLDNVLKLLGFSFKSLCCYTALKDEGDNDGMWIIKGWATGIMVEEEKKMRGEKGLDVAASVCKKVLELSSS